MEGRIILLWRNILNSPEIIPFTHLTWNIVELFQTDVLCSERGLGVLES